MNRTHVLPALLALLLTAAACGDPEAELAAIQVASASLRDISIGTGAIVVGATSGSATLDVADEAGGTRSFPVRLEGPLIGPAITVQGEESWVFDPPDGTFELPGDDVTADQLFGLYNGSAAGIALVIGVTEHELENDHGVKLKTDYLTIGVGFLGALEWLTVSLDDGSDDEPAADAGPATEEGDAGAQ